MTINRDTELDVTEGKIAELKAQLRQCESEQKLKCFHTKYSGADLVPIMNAKNVHYLTREEKLKYPPNTVVCSRCGEIIDPTIFTERQLNEASFRMRSALAQIQIIVGAKLDDQEKAELSSAFTNLGYVDTLLDGFYNDMTRRMTDKKGPRNKNKANKGGIGITNSMLR